MTATINLWPVPFLALAAAAGWSALPEGESYPLPAAEARRILRATTVPDGIYGSGAITATTKQRGDGTVVWTVRQDGHAVFRYEAQVIPENARTTRVSVALIGERAGRNGDVAARLESESAVADFYLAAMEEQIDAALERRPANWEALMDDFALAAASQVARMSSDMDRARETWRARDRASIERAYREEVTGGNGSFGEEAGPDNLESFE